MVICTRINECCSNCINIVWRKIAYRIWVSDGRWLNHVTGQIEVRYIEDTPYYISNVEIIDVETIV